MIRTIYINYIIQKPLFPLQTVNGKLLFLAFFPFGVSYPLRAQVGLCPENASHILTLIKKNYGMEGRSIPN